MTENRGYNNVDEAYKSTLKRKAVQYLPKNLDSIQAQKRVLQMIVGPVPTVKACLDKAEASTWPKVERNELPMNHAVAQCAYEINKLIGITVIENLKLEDQNDEDLLKAWIALDYYAYVLKSDYAANIRKLQDRLAGILWEREKAQPVITMPVQPAAQPMSQQENSETGKKKTKGNGAVAIIVILLALVVGSFTFHFWSAPTCTEASTCTICGKENEPALGHDWVQATCTQAKTCSRCSATEGNALGHNWKGATCTDAKKCEVCNTVEGKALGHNWKAATYDAPKTCSRCSKTEGNIKGYIGTVNGRYTGETYVRSYRRTYVYQLDKKLDNCRKFTLNYTVTDVNYGNIYGRFEVFVHTGENSWDWESVGMFEITEDKESASVTFELDPGISFDALSVFCQAYGSYSYSAYMTVTEAQLY